MEKVDQEMRDEIQDDKKTNPGNLILLIIGIVVGLLLIAIAGGYISMDSKNHPQAKNVGDTLIINQPDTLKN